MSTIITQDKSKEFIFFASSSMILTALGIDIMLPAFASLREHFGLSAESTETANLINYFFMGQVTQLIFGYLTDKHGRLPILRIGIIIYLVCGFVTIFVPSLQWMFVLRFLSGMGSAAVFMTTIASVRDRYSGDSMARVMSFALTILLLTPILAPALGTVILKYYSWKVVFLVPPVFSLFVLLWSFRIRESLLPAARSKEPFSAIWPKLYSIITDTHFLRFSFIATLLFSILSTYISSSEHIVGEIYGRPDLFPYIFGAMGILMALFSLSNSYFSRKFGARTALKYYLMAYFAAACVLLILYFTMGDPPQMSYFFVLISLLLALTLAADPNSSAIALEFMGDKAGVAASVYGTIFFFVGSAIGALVSGFLEAGVLALMVAAFVIGSIALMLFHLKRR